MTALKRHNYTEGFPKVSAQLYEGTITRYDTVGPDGMKQTDMGVYSLPVAKGDLVRIRAHTTNGLLLMEKAVATNEYDWAHGICISDPIGSDDVTASAGTPAAAQQRTATVALFGLGVIELTASATSAIAPGDSLALDEDENNEVEVDVAYASTTKADNGSMIALTYAAAGYKVAVGVGMSCVFTSD